MLRYRYFLYLALFQFVIGAVYLVVSLARTNFSIVTAAVSIILLIGIGLNIVFYFYFKKLVSMHKQKNENVVE
ncbi:hypothetical protein DES38_102304 [Streptohalobacillus salinus]|uniref:Uncharacterized protein n=1 Tax=Streptohalobacillus salinus TaxID=621096 RepID=A0A2V3WD85_9BACI|nr:hypothetical protein [Streptohalobacillus salinus]PXW92720.1 hypothetical protein DES38_102304 [Streptohalobacillus salinus]